MYRNTEAFVGGLLTEVRPRIGLQSPSRVMGRVRGGGEIIDFGVVYRGNHLRPRARLVFGVFLHETPAGSVSAPTLALRINSTVNKRGRVVGFEHLPLPNVQAIKELDEPLANKVVNRIVDLHTRGIL